MIDAAKAHAQMRFEQGLGPVAIVTEFRLLRHEIGRALITSVDDAPARDILAGQAVIDDALDGAATVGLDALSDRVESLREEFLATTVHDIRQPITLVTGRSTSPPGGSASPNSTAQRITEVVKSAVVAVNEINIMLDTLGDASRLAMGALEPEPEPAKLDAIVADALALLDAETRRQIDFEPSADQLVGLWDPHLLRRVVSNLISNALKYSPGGGRVEIETGRAADGHRPARDPRPRHGSDHRGSRDACSIASCAPSALEPQGIPGLGLGLYACRGIVAAHGGTIVLHSDGPGSGTTVVVALPLDRGRRRRLTPRSRTGRLPRRNTLARQPQPPATSGRPSMGHPWTMPQSDVARRSVPGARASPRGGARGAPGRAGARAAHPDHDDLRGQRRPRPGRGSPPGHAPRARVRRVSRGRAPVPGRRGPAGPHPPRARRRARDP